MAEPSYADCYQFARTFQRWIELRAKYVREQGYTPALTMDNIATELWKSRLFYWLLRGNEPLALPPPKYMSGPQHELAVDGGFIETIDPPRVERGKVMFSDLHPNFDLVDYLSDGLLVEMPAHLEGRWSIRVTRRRWQQHDVEESNVWRLERQP